MVNLTITPRVLMKSKNNVKGKRRCYYGKLCHFSKYWYKKKNEYKEKASGGENAALVYNRIRVYKSFSPCWYVEETEWWMIFDSGWSFHMCPNKNYFLDFEKIVGGHVIMENNITYKNSVIGTIKMLLDNGNFYFRKE